MMATDPISAYAAGAYQTAPQRSAAASGGNAVAPNDPKGPRDLVMDRLDALNKRAQGLQRALERAATPEQRDEIKSKLGDLQARRDEIRANVDARKSQHAGDYNGDGVVDPLDWGHEAARTGEAGGPPEADGVVTPDEVGDANGDGVVDPLDVGYYLSRL